MTDEDHYVSMNEKNVLLSLHPDSMLIARNDLEFAQSIKRWLSCILR